MSLTTRQFKIDLRRKGNFAGVCALLVGLVLAVYWQVGTFDFLIYDDDVYVTKNPYVINGLTTSGLKWAFTSTQAANWHPLTWLSHMLAVEIWGLDPGSHHFFNVFFHASNAILLFALLKITTGSLWRSALVSGLFALHPMNVQSVSWVAQHKSLLSTFFWLLTAHTYVRYAAGSSRLYYLASIAFFAFGLSSKPMLVTLPLSLLLLDVWPLRRVNLRILQNEGVPSKTAPIRSLIIEKIPFFVLSIASSVVTIIAQSKGGAVQSVEAFPLGVRIANALVAYVKYLYYAVWPSRLAALYPHAGMPTWWQLVIACVVLTGIMLFAWIMIRRTHAIIVGWLWYIGTLVPVIGFVQVGSQGLADRYTYVPFIGLFIMVAWSIPELSPGVLLRRLLVSVMAVVWLLMLAIVSHKQALYWSTSLSLFGRCLEVTENNWIAHSNMGIALMAEGRIDPAINHLRTSLLISPGRAKTHNNLGSALFHKGQYDEAIMHYQKALEIVPDYRNARNNLRKARVFKAMREIESGSKTFAP